MPTATLAQPPAPSQTAALLRLSDALLLAVAVVWGTSYGVAKGALAHFPVLGFLAVRFLLTLLCLSPALWRLNRAGWRASLATGLPTGGLLLGIFLCETYGVALAPASQAAVLISLCVLFTPVVEWAWLGKRPGRVLWLAASASLLGAAALALGGEADLSASPGLGWGVPLLLAAAALRGLTLCVTRQITQAQATPAPALAVTAVQAAVVGGACALLQWATAPALPALPQVASFWWACAYLVVGCTVFAFFAQNWALRHSSPSRVALLTGTEPVWGALFAVAWLGESLTPLQWAGAAVVVGATVWATRRQG